MKRIKADEPPKASAKSAVTGLKWIVTAHTLSGIVRPFFQDCARKSGGEAFHMPEDFTTKARRNKDQSRLGCLALSLRPCGSRLVFFVGLSCAALGVSRFTAISFGCSARLDLCDERPSLGSKTCSFRRSFAQLSNRVQNLRRVRVNRRFMPAPSSPPVAPRGPNARSSCAIRIVVGHEPRVGFVHQRR